MNFTFKLSCSVSNFCWLFCNQINENAAVKFMSTIEIPGYSWNILHKIFKGALLITFISLYIKLFRIINRLGVSVYKKTLIPDHLITFGDEDFYMKTYGANKQCSFKYFVQYISLPLRVYNVFIYIVQSILLYKSVYLFPSRWKKIFKQMRYYCIKTACLDTLKAFI